MKGAGTRNGDWAERGCGASSVTGIQLSELRRIARGAGSYGAARGAFYPPGPGRARARACSVAATRPPLRTRRRNRSSGAPSVPSADEGWGGASRMSS